MGYPTDEDFAEARSNRAPPGCTCDHEDRARWPVPSNVYKRCDGCGRKYLAEAPLNLSPSQEVGSRSFLTEVPTRKRPVRVGDTVRVLAPRTVERVGYRKLPTDYLSAVRQVLSTAAGNEAVRTLQALLEVRLFATANEERLVDALAVAKCRADRFGGPERGVWVRREPESIVGGVGQVIEVTRKRIGTYYPPRGGYVNEHGESDWESGGLRDPRWVVLCRVDLRPREFRLFDGSRDEPLFLAGDLEHFAP